MRSANSGSWGSLGRRVASHLLGPQLVYTLTNTLLSITSQIIDIDMLGDIDISVLHL